jgi:hypothetical protein
VNRVAVKGLKLSLYGHHVLRVCFPTALQASQGATGNPVTGPRAAPCYIAINARLFRFDSALSQLNILRPVMLHDTPVRLSQHHLLITSMRARAVCGSTWEGPYVIACSLWHKTCCSSYVRPCGV